MKTLTGEITRRTALVSILTDIGALAFIYLVPTISHLLRLPVYLAEPMRLSLILALAHTSKRNAYFLALSMPLFSLVISGHPVLPKMLLIAFELSLNVFLFYAFSKRLKHIFPSVLLSIVLSKAMYYLLKFIMIRFAVIDMELIMTPILVQMATTLVFSIYLAGFYRNPWEKFRKPLDA